MTGITPGADPLSWPIRHASVVFVPWAYAEGIVLYRCDEPFGWRIGDDPSTPVTAVIGIATSLRRPKMPSMSST